MLPRHLTAIISCVLFSVIVSNTIAQGPIHKAWILTKQEMIDSSSVIDPFTHNHPALHKDPYLRMEFNRNQKVYVSQTPAEIGDPIRYSVNESQLTIYNGQAFQIEKSTSDTLILVENNAIGLADDKVKRFYFIPEETQIERIVSQQTPTDTIMASVKLSPKLNQRFGTITGDDLSKIEGKGFVSGSLYVSEDTTTFEIKDTGGLKPSKLKRINKALTKLHGKWIFPEPNQAKVYTIDFFLEFNFKTNYYFRRDVLERMNASYQKTGMIRFMPFVVNSVDYSDFFEKHVSLDEHYDKATAYFNEQNYSSAIQELDSCIMLLPNHVDSRYLRAYSYFKLEKLTEACPDINHLVSLNQKTAIRLQKEFCK